MRRSPYINHIHRAADLIERVGLHKGGWWPGAEQAGGARHSYRDGDPVSIPGALHLLYDLPEALGAILRIGHSIDIPNCQVWGDQPDVTTADALAVLREAAGSADDTREGTT